MRVFAFLDLEFPPVAWAVMRGMLVSADQTHPEAPENGFVSFMLAGMIQYQRNDRIFNESIIEHVRATRYPRKISRLRGMYFFRSREDALSRIGDRDWPKYFTRENLVELELYPALDPTVCDANWITFANLRSDGRIATEDLTWIDNYWSGKPYSDNAPVWEMIANGVALVLDERIRRQCDALVKKRFPESHIPILMARLASEAGSLGGLISPFVIRDSNMSVRLCYLGREADFHDPAVIEKIGQHPDAGSLGQQMRENETWKSPDFRPWGQEFSFGVQTYLAEGEVPIVSIHHNP